mmetsp:Transcript_29250/g.66206  ORF Transcript_29250/g.66206 Transcript_29250/m.66206 type:complete len:83 (-) Transcript_29250:319-567(-)
MDVHSTSQSHSKPRFAQHDSARRWYTAGHGEEWAEERCGAERPGRWFLANSSRLDEHVSSLTWLCHDQGHHKLLVGSVCIAA